MSGVLAGLGLLVGVFLPRLLARIPDRVPADGEPPSTPYRQLAAAPRLQLALGVWTALVWALTALALPRPEPAELGAYLVVGALGVAMAYVDLREHRLPDWLTLPALAGAGLLLAVAAGVSGDWAAYGRAWAAAAACFMFYLLLALARPADLGLGDVKLAAVLGLLLGWSGWPTVLLGVFCGFLVGGVAGVALLVSGRANRRSSLPFGPPMLVGALAALLWVRFVVPV